MENLRNYNNNPLQILVISRLNNARVCRELPKLEDYTNANAVKKQRTRRQRWAALNVYERER